MYIKQKSKVLEEIALEIQWNTYIIQTVLTLSNVCCFLKSAAFLSLASQALSKTAVAWD